MEKKCYYGENYGTSDKTNGIIPKTIELRFIKGKIHGKLPKTVKSRFIKKKNHNGNIPKQFKFLNNYIA